MKTNKLGTVNNPYLVAPDDWHENGVFYGAYCKCDNCGLIEHSTLLFDYYAKEPGDALVCESCTFGKSYKKLKVLIDKLEQDGVFDDSCP